MMKIAKKYRVIMLAGLVGCGTMALVDGLWQPGYWVKSAVKLTLFLLLPLAASALGARETLRALPRIFRANRQALLRSSGLGVGVFAVILGGYYTLGQLFDLTAITGALTENVGVTGENFLFVAIYISLVNSLLEEFFFRGFLFLGLLDGAPRWLAYSFSAILFALYHIAMMFGWGSPVLILLILAALFAGGLIFNLLNEKSHSIYPSWLVHLCANLAINTIGFILFAAA